MPELPEVETIVSQLNRKVKGKTIKSVRVFLPKLVRYPVEKFRKLVAGKKIVKVGRRGKMVLVELSNNFVLVIHLKLSGQLVHIKGGAKVKAKDVGGRHTHVIYEFTDGDWLLHNDLRQFGYIKVVAKKDLAAFLKKEKLGPEPLTKDFTLDVFKERLLEKKKAKIKALLMNQSFIVGIGNIYANEILFFAKVLPQRTAGSLKPKEIGRVFEGIKTILSSAVKRKGTSDRDYVDASGKKGKYAEMLKVYGRENESCLVCGRKIKRVKMMGRSSFFCNKCQK